MKRITFTTLFFAMAINAGCGGRSGDASIAAGPGVDLDAMPQFIGPPVPTVKGLCGLEIRGLAAELQKKIGAEFVVTTDETAGTVKAMRVELTADGQRIRESSETLTVDFNHESGKCSLRPIEVVRTFRNETRVADLLSDEHRYYRSAKPDPIELVFTEAVLRNSMWRKDYRYTDNIPERLESERKPHRKLLYYSWVQCDEDKACRLPIWVLDGVWTKEADGELALVAGDVTIENPMRHHLEDGSFFHVLRMNASYEASNRGILYPVSKISYQRFVDYGMGRTKDWVRDYAADLKEWAVAMAVIHKNKTRLLKVPMAEVWKRPEIQPAPIEERPKGCCVPDFNETGPLF